MRVCDKPHRGSEQLLQLVPGALHFGLDGLVFQRGKMAVSPAVAADEHAA